MKRREFVNNGLNGVLAPIFLNGFNFKQLSGTVQPAGTCSFDDRVLVIVYLAGANDIINTAVPLNQWSDYYEDVRQAIPVTDNPLNLHNLDENLDPRLQLGLHPNLGGLKNLYDNDKLGIIQRVGYPNPNRSHFASEDIMFKGIDGLFPPGDENEGWVGRFLKDKHPTYKGLPFGNLLDPLGIILGDTPDTGFHTLDEHDMEINLSGQDSANFDNIISSLSGEPISQFPPSEHGNMLNHLAAVEKSTQVYSERIQETFNLGENRVDYTNDQNDIYELSDQLRTVARFISGGSTTKVYMARIGGWDTHNDQLNRHGALLSELGFSLEKFQQDLSLLNVSHKVVTVVFSEFARKLTVNGNGGTDHGTISSMFVVGDHINKDHTETSISTLNEQDYLVDKGIFGMNQDLLDYLGGDFSGAGQGGAANPAQRQHDYRAVFASILRDWLGADNPSIQNTFSSTASSILNTHIPIIKPAVAVDSSCPYVQIEAATIKLNLKVFLEGFYDPITGLMTTDLNTNGVLPLEQPFDNLFFNYFGDEVVDNQFPTLTVDWVFIELYDSNGLVKKRQPALLKDDGSVTDLDGNSPLVIEDLHPEEHKVAIFHRSHLGVIFKNSFNVVDGDQYNYDLTTSDSLVEGSKQLKEIAPGVYGLFAGDLDNNGLINTNDFGRWSQSNGLVGYKQTDLDSDGLTDTNDYNIWKNNRSKIGSPALHKHLKSN